jgi:hypothetical protein
MEVSTLIDFMERKWEKTRSVGNEETGKISSSLAVLVKQWQARSTTATRAPSSSGSGPRMSSQRRLSSSSSP